ncbi:hypothetical protein OROHE_008233 [Orobanche hederae]
MVLDNEALYDIFFRTLKLTTPSCNAVRAFNASKGKKMVPTFKQLTGNLKRPGTLESGFCVCRYMKEIIESDDPDLEKMYGGGPVRINITVKHNMMKF